MTDLPEKTCSIDRLVTHEKLVAATLDGRKTQQRRNGVYGYPGECFELEGVKFQVTELRRQKLGEMVEQDAHAEGYPNLEVYKTLIIRMHGGMDWDLEHPVWVHEFKRVEDDASTA
ncbi:MAG: ASCH domain-containing protein [Planctomycetota bacterium]|nr:ASCH domain-containing protein [Planctomycetota bacterium]MEC7979597.1 ASCH domain-containing protein [Planctomycetota bacterium]MEC8161553.1 ASCH domain-containing protein [Planctomycetota bacterium]MEC8506932.1 ASCH domain-containing protein [Planctomycetota bacterium]MEC8589924.1 ASCH domain-containing protein [Planctomycetota bacterium]